MNPTFIACGARSGSTLLRWLIDAHPDVACPSETDVASLVGDFHRSIGALGVNHDRAGRAIDEMVDAYLDDVGKSNWADKSMSNAMNLDLLAETWPGARFILLHRHVMDFIASALEAQPWGLTDYGFMPFASQCPGDDVAALARYWVDRTTRMLAFERSCAHDNLRLRYEDLVIDPGPALSAVWALLGVPTPPDGPDAAFEAPHDAHGSADHMIWYTSAVSSASVGRGARVPPARVGGTFRGQVNGLLSELGYPLIDDNWGAGGLVPVGGDPGAVMVRIVRGHQTLSYAGTSSRPSAVIAVEQETAALIVEHRINMGGALRNRLVRYYGPALSGYGEERDLFGSLEKILMEMV